jgi:hypothetical protein
MVKNRGGNEMEHNLQAGFGKSEIKFDSSMFPTEGFMGIHDDPAVRIMVWETAGMRMVIACADLVMLPDHLIAELREKLAEITGAQTENVWIHVTHAITTPHEPGPMGPPDKRPPETEEDRRKKTIYADAIREAFVQAAQMAKSLVPAKLGVGYADCDANCNRDKKYGDVWWTGLNPDGPSNKRMSVIRVERLEGAPLGFFVSYGIKPCAIDNCMMKEGKRLISSDVCGYCSRMLEEKFGVPALFGVSAAGDQVPKQVAWIEIINEQGEHDLYQEDVESGLRYVQKYGSLMGDTAIAIAESVQTEECITSIKRSSAEVSWPMRPAPGRSQAGSGTIPAELMTLGDIAFVAEKPEINCVTERQLLEASPFAHTFLLCMVNGGMKYMADAASYDRNTFEAQRSAPEKGAAEAFVEAVAEALKGM